MKLAFFNWRDIKHPNAGGSEVFVHNLLIELKCLGHDVTLFTSKYPGSNETELIDGINHVRYGGKYTIYLRSFFIYKKFIEGNFDFIVESINGIPFFTPLFAKEKTVSYIHQLTKENWFSALPYPIAFLFFYLESFLLIPYKKLKTAVPSESTAVDLRNLGFFDISIIPGASKIQSKGKKANETTLIFLGRLAKSKKVSDAILAYSIFKKDNPFSKLWVVGSGNEEGKLKKMAPDGVHFFGFVDEQKKAELLSKAHVLLFPAVREGFGLVVLEANSCSTPVVGYDVPGLRDSIIDGVNGYLVKDPASMAAKTSDIMAKYEHISRMAKNHSMGFSWAKTANEFSKRMI